MTVHRPHRLLGEFLRTHRERCQAPPASTGARRRRTPGLRREEVAAAAGVSVTWLTWLEQGREVQASAFTLGKVAEALRLTPAERASLFDLAERRDPLLPEASTSALSAAVLDLPQQLSIPAYILDGQWTACAWNTAASLVFTGWLDQAAKDRNLLRFVFCQPAAQRLLGKAWPERAARLVAEFRADFSRRPFDPGLQELVRQLQAHSPAFAGLWQNQAVLPRDGGPRSFLLPDHSVQMFHQSTLVVAEAPDYKLVCLTPLPVA